MVIRIIIGLAIGAAAGGLIGYFGRCRTGACPLTGNPFTGAMLGALVGGLIAGQLAGRQAPGTEEASPYVQAITSQEDFDGRVLKADGPVVVDFYATWCGPCKVLAPTIGALAEDYQGKVAFVKVDVDRLRGLAGAYRIAGFPTVLLFDRGREVRRWDGVRRAGEYRQALDDLLSERAGQ